MFFLFILRVHVCSRGTAKHLVPSLGAERWGKQSQLSQKKLDLALPSLAVRMGRKEKAGYGVGGALQSDCHTEDWKASVAGALRREDLRGQPSQGGRHRSHRYQPCPKGILVFSRGITRSDHYFEEMITTGQMENGRSVQRLLQERERVSPGTVAPLEGGMW